MWCHKTVQASCLRRGVRVLETAGLGLLLVGLYLGIIGLMRVLQKSIEGR